MDLLLCWYVLTAKSYITSAYSTICFSYCHWCITQTLISMFFKWIQKPYHMKAKRQLGINIYPVIWFLQLSTSPPLEMHTKKKYWHLFQAELCAFMLRSMLQKNKLLRDYNHSSSYDS